MWCILGIILGDVAKLITLLMSSNTVYSVMEGDEKFFFNWVTTSWSNYLNVSILITAWLRAMYSASNVDR